MSFFSLDSKFSQIMGRVFDLMMLNIIFLIMCIPIVTIGANFTAMYYVTLKMIKNEETYIFRTYWKSFRENFKQATAIWLILLAVLIVLILDLLLVMRMPGTITYLRFVFLVLIFFEAMVLSYVFPVLSRFDNTVKNTIKNSILMAIRHLPWTIMILLVNLCPLLIYVFSTTKIVSYLILLMFLLGFSTVALGCSWFFVNKIFPFYMPEEEKEVLTPEEESLRALEAMDRPSPLTERSDDAAPAETTDAAETASEEESARNKRINKLHFINNSPPGTASAACFPAGSCRFLFSFIFQHFSGILLCFLLYRFRYDHRRHRFFLLYSFIKRNRNLEQVAVQINVEASMLQYRQVLCD